MIRLKVKEVAAAKGISQRQVSVRTGIDINAIRRIFRNPVGIEVKLDTLDRIAKVLGVDVSELIESIDEGKEGE